jgi:putative transposase
MTSNRDAISDRVGAYGHTPLQEPLPPERHRRRSIRLKGYDYSQAGAYFITICTLNRECLFGDLIDSEMRLNDAGRIVHEEWLRSADLRSYATINELVIMPNHLHGVIVLQERDRRGTARRAPTTPDIEHNAVTETINEGDAIERFGRPMVGSIPTIVRAVKSATTRRINEHRQTPGSPVWQRNYYEHIIRNDDELRRIRQYIVDNPAQWALDRENPDAIRVEPEEGHGAPCPYGAR